MRAWPFIVMHAFVRRRQSVVVSANVYGYSMKVDIRANRLDEASMVPSCIAVSVCARGSLRQGQLSTRQCLRTRHDGGRRRRASRRFTDSNGTP